MTESEAISFVGCGALFILLAIFIVEVMSDD